MNEDLNGLKSHTFDFFQFLGVETVSGRITVRAKKIGRCWNGRWMGSSCDSGIESLRCKARGTNYVVLN